MQETILDAALKYRSLGFSVIPVFGKISPIQWKEYQNRIATQEEINEWLIKYPKANIAIVTGPISKLLVVDVDEGADISNLYLPPTVVVKTGNNGFHYFYKYPKEKVLNAAGIIPNVDIRGLGGYVVAPPSIHPNGNRYELIGEFIGDEIADCPLWVYEKKNVTEKRSLSQIANGVSEGSRNSSSASFIGYFLKYMPEGSWESLVLPALRGWNAGNNFPPLDDQEFSTIFHSIAKAQKNQLINQSSTSNNLLNDFIGIYYKEFINKEYPPNEWLVDKLIPMRSISILSGPPKVGKSWLALDMALAISSGRTFLSAFKTKQSKILYISKDEGLDITQKRAKQFCGSEIQPIIFMTHPALMLDNPEHINKVKEIIINEKIEVIIVDNLRRILSGKEDSSDDINKLQQQLRILLEVGVTIIFIHHHSKENPLSKRTGLDRLRGSSDIGAMCDTHLTLEKTKGDCLVLTQTALRIDRPQQPMLIQIPNDTFKYFQFRKFLEETDQESKKQTKEEIAAQKVVEMIKKGAKYQTEIIPKMDNISPGTIQNAIKKLEREGKITTRKEGKQIICELIEEEE